MPRVGSSMMMMSGSLSMVLPSISFCWLPPDRRPTATAASRALMSKRRTARSSALASLEPSRKPNLRCLFSVSRVRFGRRPILSSRPLPLRSLVM
ncbi:hypothetical protein D3C72_1839650 [compost metagenome]